MRDLFLRWMRVPPEPHPPAGSPGSIRIFRAAPNFYYWNLFHWVLAQLTAAAVLGLTLIALARVYPKLPPFAQMLFVVFETVAVAVFVLQLPLSYWKQRLDFELRWYIVTDRSLRIRDGIWTVQEVTMTFANIQKIDIAQGPLQKILGIANVTVTSAGGGAASAEAGKHARIGAHAAKFAGVSNAREIRDLILERLRQYRDAGLGDPDDSRQPQTPTASNEAEASLEAAQELLEEARRLRLAVTSGRSL